MKRTSRTLILSCTLLLSCPAVVMAGKSKIEKLKKQDKNNDNKEHQHHDHDHHDDATDGKHKEKSVFESLRDMIYENPKTAGAVALTTACAVAIACDSPILDGVIQTTIDSIGGAGTTQKIINPTAGNPNEGFLNKIFKMAVQLIISSGKQAEFKQ